ncbi:ABC transporter substrate-binding protein [Bordetella flabilis]|uniref:Peptide ABC transporter n=1 Tax=Bordetella flabilis TaxID=463014 RepID=A0A193GA66_9BORD|nr:ABC transporter substrate-binding protein [Bordetella flabilis]ANN76887.1 peptide ABC transporter [Bordetella flabilis]
MNALVSRRRDGLKTLLLAAALSVAALGCPAGAAPVKGGTISVATIGEPPTLDPMASTADLVGIISQHIYETLYTFDAKWNVTPLLAEKLPVISSDGLTYTIPVRTDVTFHDGSKMTVNDVIASLQRWTTTASRGKQIASLIAGIDAPDDHTVRITLNQPYAPLLALLAMNNGAAVIMPKARMAATITEYIGTGPYMVKARVPDQYLQLARYPGYSARSGEPDGYGGARMQYLDEIRFVPVPNANTRVESAVAGQYDYVDAIPVESAAKLKSGSSQALLLKPFGWPRLVLNTRQGIMANVKMRQAVQLALNEEDMLAAAFGSTDYYAVDGAMYPKGYPWHTDKGAKAVYNKADAAGAKKLIEASGVTDRTIRILTSQQYEFHYKMALVAAEYLKLAGFKVDMQVVDWATLTQRRQDPALWDIFITHSPFLPEPALIDFPSKTSPGWWDTPLRDKVLTAFNRATTQDERVQRWADVQQAIFDEVPFIKVGDFNAVAAKSPALEGVTAAPWPYFWNAWKAPK